MANIWQKNLSKKFLFTKNRSFFWHRLQKQMLNSNRIYILPTKYGCYFFAIMFILFLISLSYGHSLAYSATFIFVSIVLTSAFYTNFNLSHIRLVGVSIDRQWRMGELGHLSFTWANDAEIKRFDLDFSLKGREFGERLTLTAKEKGTVSLPLMNLERGPYRLKRVKVSTAFPFGLFYSWRYFICDYSFFVLPALADSCPPLPHRRDTAAGQSEEGDHLDAGSEDYYEHEIYQEGMPLRGIDWKAYARGRDLMVKKFVDLGADRYELFLPEGEGRERAIQILSRWIETLKDQGSEWSLSLPHKKLSFSHGVDFFNLCNKELAYLDKREVEITS